MKKTLVSALALVAMAGAATAQLTVPLAPLTLPPQDGATVLPTEPIPGPLNSLSSVEERYGWGSRHYQRLSTEAPIRDSNTMNFYVPLALGQTQTGFDTEVRGIGQLFAPGVIYDFFIKDYRIEADADHRVYDSTVITQFQGAQGYTIDTIVTRYFKNPNGGLLTAPGKFYVWSTPANFAGNSFFKNANGYQKNGVSFGRSSLPEKFATELTPEGLDTTLDGDQINEVFYAFDPPLEFNAGQAAIAMYLNDEAVAVTTPSVIETDTREFQVFRGFFEKIEGSGIDREQASYKSGAMIVYRTVVLTGPNPGNYDTVVTAWSALQYGAGDAANINMSMLFFGTVDLVSGVKYHFGKDASQQGLGNVSPNPAREQARINFSLSQVSSVTLELYSSTGEKIRTLVESRYIPGNYSYDLPVADLANGTYLVRLTAGENVYSTKVNVVK